MIRKWTKSEDQRLASLAASGSWMYSEIAEKMGIDAIRVRYRAKKLGLPSDPGKHKKGKWNVKHAHLRGAVMTYFLTHTKEETRQKFNLSEKEIKSLFTIGYREEKFAHLRKDKRTHAPWSLAEWLFVIRRCGLIERGVIAKKMGRSLNGKHHAVKERVAKAGGGTTKFLNGIPIGWAEQIWPLDLIRHLAIKSASGPTGGVRGNFRFLILPWIEAERLSRVFVTPPEVSACIRAMAKFQRFIHRRSDRAIKSTLKRIVREG